MTQSEKAAIVFLVWGIVACLALVPVNVGKVWKRDFSELEKMKVSAFIVGCLAFVVGLMAFQLCFPVRNGKAPQIVHPEILQVPKGEPVQEAPKEQAPKGGEGSIIRIGKGWNEGEGSGIILQGKGWNEPEGAAQYVK